jgi:putative DNA primase/helicase
MAAFRNGEDFATGELSDFERRMDQMTAEIEAKARAKQAKAAVADMLTLSEDACAAAFVENHLNDLRYDHDAGRWYEWDGQRWRPDRTDRAFAYARELARAAAQTREPSEKKTAGRCAFASGVEKFARSDPRVAVLSDQWDRDPLLIGTPDGTVDLRTGVLREPRREDYITRLTAVEPAQEGTLCPEFMRFITEATAGDSAVIRFIQTFGGYCLTGETLEHMLLFIYGDGGTGKTTLVKTLHRILGDYAVQAAMETFTSRITDRHPEELASLAGARLVVASETEEGRRWSEARVKQLTGGDPIRARFMRMNSFEFHPGFKLLFCGNHAPHIQNMDEAMRRRFNIVPFETRPKYPDPYLDEKLEDEWPAILRWLIDGAVRWQSEGLVRPAAVSAATDEYFANQDTFKAWLEERCDVDRSNEHKKASFAELLESWMSYAKTSGEDPGGSRSFGARMRRHGFDSKQMKNYGAKGFAGICLRRPQPREWGDS